jgi:protein SCO1/2
LTGTSVLQRRSLLLGLGGGLLVAGAAVTWKSLRRPPALPEGVASPPHPGATRIDDARPLPDFRLDSPRGPLTRAWLQGRWTVLFFGYTHCPDVCPTALALMADVNRQLERSQRPQVLFVSVDPQRDTTALLAEYVPAFDPDFLGATGQDADVAPLLRHLGAQFTRHPPSASGFYTVDHTAGLFLIDPQARLKAVFTPPHDNAAVLTDLRAWIQ